MQPIDTSILSGPNAAFIAELYVRYVEDPGSVDAWVEALKGKIAEVVNRDCSQPRQAADAR